MHIDALLLTVPTVYTHPASRAIEYMVVDALLAADPYMNLSQQIDDPSRYVFLTDSVLEEIERSREPVSHLFLYNIETAYKSYL